MVRRSLKALDSRSRTTNHEVLNGPHLTGLQQKVLPEREFIGALHMERRRVERSGQSLLLILVDLTALLEDSKGEKAISNVVRVLPSVTRETDVCGWFAQNAVLAIIFNEIPSGTREPAKEAIEAKISATLQSQLRIDQLTRIRITFEFFPEAKDWKPPTPADRRRYLDIPRRNLAARPPHVIKRMMDVLGSLSALILLSPLFGLIALIIRLTSKGPVLFRQTRVGQHGIPFTFLKFRSMRADSDPELHHEYVKQFIAGNANSRSSEASKTCIYKLTADPRVVPFGRFLRKTSLDELPQFWNVLRGEMSLVGPRPQILYEVELYQPWHLRRVEAKPGITGLWQVNGRSTVAFDEMVRLDLRYVKNCSIWLDFQIILRTPRALLSGEGAY